MVHDVPSGKSQTGRPVWDTSRLGHNMSHSTSAPSYYLLTLSQTEILKVLPHFKVFEWCPIADSKTLSQTQMVSNTQVEVPETTSSFSQVVKALVKP